LTQNNEALGKQGNFSKYLESCQKAEQNDQIRNRGKQFFLAFAPATSADYLSNLFVFNLFCKNVTACQSL
jgi:hypothetical protein